MLAIAWLLCFRCRKKAGAEEGGKFRVISQHMLEGRFRICRARRLYIFTALSYTLLALRGNKKHKRGSGHRRQPSATTGGFVSVDLRSRLGQRRKIIACEIGCACIGRLHQDI